MLTGFLKTPNDHHISNQHSLLIPLLTLLRGLVSRHKVIGLILVKELAMIDKAAHTPVSTLKMRSLPTLHATTPLYDLLHLFEVGRCHMAVLTGPPPAASTQSGCDTGVEYKVDGTLQHAKSDGAASQWQQQQQRQEGHEADTPSQPMLENGHAQLIPSEPDGMGYSEVGPPPCFC